MKTKTLYLFVLLIISIIVVICLKNKENFEKKTIAKKREIHQEFLNNSPFKKTLKLSKQERKSQGLPPNKYYEREWELTMNPETGFPEPQKVYEIQKKRNSIKGKVPGKDSGSSWVDRGPNNVGGRTRVVLFDPNDATNKRVFAGGVSGGLWKNEDITDPISTWTQVSGVPSNMNVSCITIDPNNSQIWYIGTGEQYTFGAAVGNGVYKTTNGGVTWAHIPVNVTGGGTLIDPEGAFFINDILAWNNGVSTDLFLGVGRHYYGDAANPDNILGRYNYGLYKSTDNGASWSRIISGLIPNDFEVDYDGNIWMGTISSGGLVYNSSDGISWNHIITLPNSDRVELAVSNTNASIIYALTEGTTNTGPHIYGTDDGFLTTPIELPKPNDADNGISASDFTRGQDFYNLVIEVDPTNDAIVYVGGIDLFRSSNSGTSWSQISKWSNNPGLNSLTCSLVHADQHAFTFRPGDSNEAVIGCDGGVYYANDLSLASSSDVFTAMNTDYNVTQFYYGGYGQNAASELILAGAQDNGTQFMNNAVPGANSSVEVSGGDGAFSTIDKDGTYMITSYLYGNHYYKSLPYPSTSTYTIDDNDYEGDFINQAALDHNLNILYSNGTSGTYAINRYTLGSSFATKLQLTNTLLDASPTAFKVSPHTTDKSILLVGLESHKLLKLTNANETNSSLICWEEITGTSFVGSISDIEFGETENDIFVTFHNYGVSNIWYTSNGGASWEEKEGDLNDMPVKCILQNPLARNEVIVGTELGVWTTNNFNEVSPTWTSSFSGMRDVKVVDLDLRTSDNSVLASTFGRGTFTGSFDGTTEATFTISTSNSIINTCKSSTSEVFNLEYKPLGGYSTNTTFSVSGIPTGASYVLSSNTFSNSNGSFNLTINDINSVAIGEHVITVTGVGGPTVSKDLLLVVRDNVSSITTISPSNGAIQQDVNNTSLVWNVDSEATIYDVEIATDADFNTIIESNPTCNTSYSIYSTLDLNTVYYWRVRAKNNCNTGDFTETQKFITNPLNDCISSTPSFTNNTPSLIDDGILTESEINIDSNNDFTINKVNVSINISHTYIGDFYIKLISPNNTEVTLYDYGCDSEDDLIVTFDDDALSSINCGASAVNDMIMPLNTLSAFIGENSVGVWRIEIWDGGIGDTGTLNSWSLNFEGETCTPQTITNSSFLNSLLTIGASTPYVLNQTETEAVSSGSLPNEQVFTISSIPSLGNLTLNDTNLSLGETFTQDDINNGKVKYVNAITVNNTDSFIVDITNATNGFLPNQQVDISIDATALSIDNQFFKKTGTTIFPTVSSGDFSLLSKTTLGKTLVEVYSVNGQKVYSNSIDIRKGNLKNISIDGLASGIYILQLTSDKISGSKKLIIK